MIGTYNFTILIREYRNETLLSTTLRDIQFRIVSIDGVSFTSNSLPDQDIFTNVGETVNFDFLIGEGNDEEIQVRAFGLPFLINNPSSVDIPDGFIAGPVGGNFNWDILEEHEVLSPINVVFRVDKSCLLYTSPSPRDATLSRMPSSA